MVKRKVVINFKLCLVGQCFKDEDFFENPTSYDKLVAAVKERASYGESRYSEIWSSLKVLSVEELKVKQGTWHRKCYQDATHSRMLKGAKERYERALAGPNESRRKTRNLQKKSPSTNSLDQRKPLTTKQCVSSAMVKDLSGKSSGKLEP